MKLRPAAEAAAGNFGRGENDVFHLSACMSTTHRLGRAETADMRGRSHVHAALGAGRTRSGASAPEPSGVAIASRYRCGSASAQSR